MWAPPAPTILFPIIWCIWKEVNVKKKKKRNHKAIFLFLYYHLHLFIVTISWVAV